MKRPKRHHYVSAMQQRQFTDDEGKLYFFQKDHREKGVTRSSPINIFVKSGLYTQFGKDDKKDVSFETDYLSPLESEASTIIYQIISAARSNQKPQLTPKQRASWDEFFCVQNIRSPDVIDPIIEDYPREESAVLDEFEKNIRPLTPEERSSFEDPGELAKRQHNIRATSPSWVSFHENDAMEILNKKGLLIGICRRPRKSFVIGSNPTVKLSDWDHLSDPSAEFWLPIAHDIIVTHYASYGVETLIDIEEDEKIRRINKSIYSQSSVIAGRSCALIASLAGLKKRTK